MLRAILGASLVFAWAGAAWAGPAGPSYVTTFQGQTPAVATRGVSTASVCVVSYGNDQCTASTVPYACCTGVATGTCTCAGGTLLTGNVTSVILQNVSTATKVACSQTGATPVVDAGAGTGVGFFLAAGGGSVTLNNATRGLNINCIADTTFGRVVAIIESK